MPRSARDDRRETTRKRVYDAALEVFRRDGVAAARIDEIVQIAGVARGTFYFHYPTREDVLRELLAEAQQDLARRLDALPDDATVDQVLQSVVTGMAERWQNEPRLLTEVAGLAIKIPPGGLSALNESYPALGVLGARLRRAADRGEIDTTLPPELLASFFLTSLLAAAVAWCEAPEWPLVEMFAPVVVFFTRATSRSR